MNTYKNGIERILKKKSIQFGDIQKIKDTKRSLVSEKTTIRLGQKYNVLVSLYVLKMIERTQKQIQEIFIAEFKLVCTS